MEGCDPAVQWCGRLLSERVLVCGEVTGMDSLHAHCVRAMYPIEAAAPGMLHFCFESACVCVWVRS